MDREKHKKIIVMALLGAIIFNSNVGAIVNAASIDIDAFEQNYTAPSAVIKDTTTPKAELPAILPKTEQKPFVEPKDVYVETPTIEVELPTIETVPAPLPAPEAKPQPQPKLQVNEGAKTNNDYNDFNFGQVVEEYASIEEKYDNTIVYQNNADFSFFDFDSYGGGTNQFIYDSFTNTEDNNEEKDKPVIITTTIQYSSDKDAKYPIYVDTGILATMDSPIEFKDIKELLIQIAVVKNGKVVEDIDKALLLVEGRTIVIDAHNTTGEDIEKMFEDLSFIVKIQDTRRGGKFNLADYLELKGDLPIVVNGIEIELSTDPMLIDSKVLFPVRSVAESLGANVKWDEIKKEAIITKDDKTIVIKANSDIVKVNKDEYLVTSKAYLNQEAKRLLSLIKIIVNELGGTMAWDSIQCALVIDTPQEKINPDKDI